MLARGFARLSSRREGRSPLCCCLVATVAIACASPEEITGDGGGATDGAAPDAMWAPPPGEQVFDVRVLHQIDIVVEDQYLEMLENDRENRVPCTFTSTA